MFPYHTCTCADVNTCIEIKNLECNKQWFVIITIQVSYRGISLTKYTPIQDKVT